MLVQQVIDSSPEGRAGVTRFGHFGVAEGQTSRQTEIGAAAIVLGMIAQVFGMQLEALRMKDRRDGHFHARIVGHLLFAYCGAKLRQHGYSSVDSGRYIGHGLGVEHKPVAGIADPQAW